jgi:hypothetical protein
MPTLPLIITNSSPASTLPLILINGNFSLVIQPDRVERFLNAMNTKKTSQLYRTGLTAFAEFYKPQGTLVDFMNRVLQDQKLTVEQGKQFIARTTMQTFIAWLSEKQLAAKTINSHGLFPLFKRV